MDNEYQLEVRQKMLKCLDVIKGDVSSIRTGRATSALVENLEISAYSGSQKLLLKEMATFTTLDAMTLVIHAFDPSVKEDIVKSIQIANIGLNPVIDGDAIRISFPPLSEERRREFIKLVHVKLEAGKIMIRQIRHQEMTDLKRAFENKEITEDDRKRFEKSLQEVTDEIVAEVDALGEQKEKELLQI